MKYFNLMITAFNPIIAFFFPKYSFILPIISSVVHDLDTKLSEFHQEDHIIRPDEKSNSNSFTKVSTNLNRSFRSLSRLMFFSDNKLLSNNGDILATFEKDDLTNVYTFVISDQVFMSSVVMTNMLYCIKSSLDKNSDESETLKRIANCGIRTKSSLLK